MIAKNKKIKKRNAFRVLIFSILIGVFLLGSVGFLIISNLRINQRRAELTANIEALKKEIQILEERNRELRDGITQFGKEDFLEKEARERLGLKKPGEEVVVITPLEGVQEKLQEEKNFWQKILDPVRNFFGDLQ